VTASAVRSSRIRVRYAETDQMGVVYYANYLVWFEVGATLMSPVRVRFDYEIWRTGEDAPLATGHTIHAAMDRRGRPCRLPPAVRELLSSMSE